MDRTDTYYTTRPNFIRGTNSPGNSFNTIWFKNIKEEKTVNTILDIAYFPGWKVFVNGKEEKITPSSDGRIKLASKVEKNKIKAYFTNTPVRTFSELISGLTFLIVLAWFLNPTYAKLKK